MALGDDQAIELDEPWRCMDRSSSSVAGLSMCFKVPK
jgi:hypothetical protein